MKLPLGITFTLLLILQTFQQVSTQIPPDWQRDNMGMDGNETQSSSEKPSVQPPPPLGESVEIRNTEGSSDDEGEPSLPTSFTFTEGDEQKQNPTTLYQIPNDTEEASSAGPIATTTPPMVALNSSSDPSDASAESNETQTQETATNTPTPEPEHTNQSDLNDTYNSAKPETTTTESSLDKSSSAYLPSDDVPTNSTTSPATTTTDGSVQYNTTVSPTEPPANRTTTPVIPFAFPEDITTPAPASEDTGANPTGPFDNRGNSERGLSSDVTDAENKKGQAWAIVLAVGIVVGIIALAAFIILNRRNRRDFSHRKLVEETSPDPVLRLDNSEPLDLKFDGFGYYNPGLQGDNIQMTNFPQGRTQ